MKLGVGVRSAVVAVTLTTLGCSTTATVFRVNAPPVEAEVVGGSRDAIYVVDDFGRRFPIPRNEIRDVDHPGNVHAAVGAAIFGYGILNIALGYSKCQDRQDNQAAFCIGVFTPAVLGAILMGWGFATHASSVDAVQDLSRPNAFPPPMPLAPHRARAPVPAEHIELSETPEPSANPGPDQAIPPPPAEPDVPPAAAAPPAASGAPPSPAPALPPNAPKAAFPNTP
jgi:hypothetical protein